MAIVNQDITVYRGEAVTFNFTMTPTEDITGWQILFTVGKATGKSRQYVTTRLMTVPAPKLITQYGELVSGPAGQFKVVLTTTQNDLATDVYDYDVWRMSPDPYTPTLLAIGKYIIGGVVRLPGAAILFAAGADESTLLADDSTATVV